MFKKIENECFNGFQYLKAKPDKAEAGDFLDLNFSKDKVKLVLCDGVSSAASDSEASQKAVQSLSSLMKKKKNIKTFSRSLVDHLALLNDELHEKELYTTFCLFYGDKDENIIATSGDSALIIRSKEGQALFHNNIYNLKCSSESIFSAPDGREHIILTCLGHHPFRYELSSDIEIDSGTELFCFSDGLLQYTKNIEQVSLFVEQIQKDPEMTFIAEKNYDDISLVYLKFK